MQVTRVYESPRVTRPYTDEQWAAIDALGEAVDVELARQDSRQKELAEVVEQAGRECAFGVLRRHVLGDQVGQDVFFGALLAPGEGL